MVWEGHSLFFGNSLQKRPLMSVQDWQANLDRLCTEAYGTSDVSSEKPPSIPEEIFLRMQGDQLSFERPVEASQWGCSWDRLKRKFLRQFTSQYDLRQSLCSLERLIYSASARNAPGTQNNAKVNAQIRALSEVLNHLTQIAGGRRDKQPSPSVQQQAAPQPTQPEHRPTKPICGGIVEQRKPEEAPSPTEPQPITMAAEPQKPVAPVFWRTIFHKRVEELEDLNKKTMAIYRNADAFKTQSKQTHFPAFIPPEMNELILGISDLRNKCFSPTCTNFDDRIELLQVLYQNLEAKYELWKRRLELCRQFDELHGKAIELKEKLPGNQDFIAKMERCAALAVRTRTLSETDLSLEQVKKVEADANALGELLKKYGEPIQAADTYAQMIHELGATSESLKERLNSIERSDEYQRIQIWADMVDRLPEDAKSQILTCLEMHELATRMVEAARSQEDMGIVEKRIQEVQEAISSLTPLLKELERKYAQHSECTLDKYGALCRLKGEIGGFDVDALSRRISQAKNKELLSYDDLKDLVEKTKALEQENQKKLWLFDEEKDKRGASAIAYLQAVNDLQESNNILLSFFPKDLADFFFENSLHSGKGHITVSTFGKDNGRCYFTTSEDS